MFSKLKTLAVLAAASATISVSAVAAPYVDVRVAPPPPRTEAFPPRAPAMPGCPATGTGAATATSG